jgi:hypothetical protein
MGYLPQLPQIETQGLHPGFGKALWIPQESNPK